MLKQKGKPINYNKVVARNKNHAIIELTEDGYAAVPIRYFPDRDFEKEELYAMDFIESFLKFGGGFFLCDDSALTEEEKSMIDEYLQKCKPPHKGALNGFHHQSLKDAFNGHNK